MTEQTSHQLAVSGPGPSLLSEAIRSPFLAKGKTYERTPTTSNMVRSLLLPSAATGKS